jgi:hypothetical protein
VQLQFGGAGKARTNLGLHTATSIVMTIFADRIPHAFELSGQGTIKSVARPVFRRKKAAEAHRHQRPSHSRQGRPDHMTGERDQT